MDKIVTPNIVFYTVLVSLFVVVALAGCKDIEHVFIVNNTNETLSVKVVLLTENGEQIIETKIVSNDSDGWQYEANAIEKKEIDKRLARLFITNDRGCKTELQRNEIIKLAKKPGVWKLNIDKDLMNCD